MPFLSRAPTPPDRGADAASFDRPEYSSRCKRSENHAPRVLKKPNLARSCRLSGGFITYLDSEGEIASFNYERKGNRLLRIVKIERGGDVRDK